MSKRLKLISASEAEMEERAFPNLYPDWEQGDPASDPEDHRNEPLDAEGQVPGRKSPEMVPSSAKLTLAYLSLLLRTTSVLMFDLIGPIMSIIRIFHFK